MPAWLQYAIISENGIGETPPKPICLEPRSMWNAVHAIMLCGIGFSLMSNAPFAIKYASSRALYLYDHRRALISFFPFPRLLWQQNSTDRQYT